MQPGTCHTQLDLTFISLYTFYLVGYLQFTGQGDVFVSTWGIEVDCPIGEKVKLDNK